MANIRAAVAGANGYAGQTLVQLLSRHPAVDLVQLTSRSLAGQPYAEIFPLRGLEGTFRSEPEAASVDVVFSYLPHNVAAGKAAAWLDAGARIIDMSADFRLHDAAAYPTWYRQEHPSPQLLETAIFGLPELHAAELPGARLIAVPGCYSTASILGLAPAVAGGLVGSDIVIDAKSGVSGAGRSPSLGAHFSEVNESVGAYAIAGHRHLPEVAQELAALAGPAGAPNLTFVPHLIPMTRGILATCYFDLVGSASELETAYRDFYADHPFTQIVSRTPTTKLAAHTNLCLINISSQGGKAVVTTAIDNLVKGASGQGVEAFNIAFGLDRTAGLEVGTQWP